MTGFGRLESGAPGGDSEEPVEVALVGIASAVDVCPLTTVMWGVKVVGEPLGRTDIHSPVFILDGDDVVVVDDDEEDEEDEEDDEEDEEEVVVFATSASKSAVNSKDSGDSYIKLITSYLDEPAMDSHRSWAARARWRRPLPTSRGASSPRYSLTDWRCFSSLSTSTMTILLI